MNRQYGVASRKRRVSQATAEAPISPDSSYNNAYTAYEDEGREPPLLPPQLQMAVLNHQTNRDESATLPSPGHVTVNHLYTDTYSREAPAEAVALSTTQRFHSKYVTVVLYKPSPRRGSG
ncbi:SNF1-related protein kinase regulatory subunit beta-3-like [Ipomoea triloba]|uniref:SNF1-related protein kinase regulatory subunit beta-3-like n=1 Tax=Ipomoea triloba TaxID=35885 RepID=UPI00125D7C6A|nr:SNF1-related protein kinase regulatory subunit beta-3-like [Ipomoea triloba]GLL43120.1 SNF1-related protein kinase regulatory subunit beta-3 [Ipomoea trifida]GMD64550.1 SNF1-related protein kinase regulatory subunit beta-3 [Ipomoea batatas]GMD74263.1 SNF1-related protein kinase regulatory subunit beta-3 [Ipomoea batatas]